MTLDCGIKGAAEHLGIHLSQARLHEIQALLKADLASITPFPDAIAGIELLQEHNVAIAVCSNLAHSYGEVVSRLFPCLDVYAYSYQMAMLKPEPQMYRWVCGQLGVAPGCEFGTGDSVHMIGDSIRCDRDGPQAVGIMGRHLDRKGGGRITYLLQFAKLIADANRR
ncbi:Haloacid dehalogenase-like family hydrolase [Pseudomonas coronafaciens pv. coronafaciens]|uniref:HAD family hydrolase n=1 Tax=Pseudomonas coronafaciens TaxID=53409 RepID=UPI000EFF585C|nr:HAD family hydrolase [Pseudomonas coronafaciens]RMS14010.1 Haloacid dehalogenase-like family hydrolase [Pseudomonas coronafaciens pv. coronafaciens]